MYLVQVFSHDDPYPEQNLIVQAHNRVEALERAAQSGLNPETHRLVATEIVFNNLGIFIVPDGVE